MRWRVPVAVAAAIAVSALLLATHASAQSLLEFDRWMQRIEKRSLSMQRSLKRKDGQTAITDAREIQELYQRMQQYFVERGESGRAVDLSAQGMELVARVIESADSENYDVALQSAIALAKDCRDCHEEYKPL